jgi:hypothetical protein
MAIYEHATSFAGKPVEAWDEAAGIRHAASVIYRIGLSHEDAEAGRRWTDKFAAFLDDPACEQVTGIVVGDWGALDSPGDNNNSAPVVEALVAARDRLPHLTAIFLGDITGEECEISWLRQSDVAPLFEAYPRLEHFCVRGGEGLGLGSPRHARLKALVVQTGGLGAGVVRALARADLPALEHLELWLGEENYGGNVRVADLAPILSGQLFPNLKYLGLRDSEIADEIAAALLHAPVLDRIRVLDLSMGTLGDEGAAALIANPAVAKLERLDIHHHYCSEEMVARLARLGIPVNADDPQKSNGDDEEDRYVAVGE